MERRKDGWKGGQKNKWTVGSEAMRGNQGTGGKRTTLGKEDRGAVTCTLKYTSTSRAACVRFLILITSHLMPAFQETGVRFPGQEDPLEKGMATHSSILAWRIPWAEELGRLQSMG